MRHKSPSLVTPRASAQRGATLAIVVFIIVVMSILGMAMVRLLSNVGQSTVSDVVGARAHAAARSGAEVLLTELFPLNENPQLSVCSERTSSLPSETQLIRFNSDGLQGCSAQVWCDQLALTEPYEFTHFRIFSTGICEAGNQTYSKQLILEASGDVE